MARACHGYPRRHPVALLLLAPGLLWLGCTTAKAPAPVAAPRAPTVPVEPSSETAPMREVGEEREATLAGERVRAIELEQQVVRLRGELAAAHRRSETLEVELADTLEEVLRTKASMRGVHSRALATSRIAEVRVAMEESSESSGAFERAGQFLKRADSELVAGNFGGAVYLADKASGVLRQARITGVTSRAQLPEERPVEALMPVLAMTISSRANLRDGPGLEFERRAALAAGEPVTALATSAEWRHIERVGGERGWVHSRLLEISPQSAAETVERAIALDPETAMETVDRVNLRRGPGVDFGRIVVLDLGAGVRAVASLGDWIKIELADGRSGWVYESLLRSVAQ